MPGPLIGLTFFELIAEPDLATQQTLLTMFSPRRDAVAVPSGSVTQPESENPLLEVTLQTAWGGGALRLMRLLRPGCWPAQAGGAVLVALDINSQPEQTARHYHNQKLQTLGTVAGGLAHDFNNLLTAILGHCEVLLGQCATDDPRYTDLAEIEHSCQRAAGMVRQLLAFSRQQPIHAELLSISDLLTSMRRLIARLLGPEVRLVVRDHASGLRICGDRIQLEQVLLNLSVNARDAMPHGGSLRLTCQPCRLEVPRRLFGYATVPAGDYVLLSVEDEGAGIPLAIRHRIFEPFFTTKQRGEGTGLGLSMVHDAVRRIGGYIDVHSEPDMGTLFDLYLPRQSVAEAVAVGMPDGERPGATVELAPAMAGRWWVLLVDDEDSVRSVAARALRRQGYQVIEASSAEQGLRMLGQPTSRIDLVVSDVAMPEMSGPEMVALARARNPALRVLFISGYEREMLPHDPLTGNRDGFLAKPFSLKQLVGKVTGMLMA